VARAPAVSATLLLLLGWLAAAPGIVTAAAPPDPGSCRTVKFADVGWTDITATTALTARLLEGLGYRTVTNILSIPVTYASMKSRQIDVYLGDWQPSMREDRKPFLADGSIEVVRANLEGAQYTLAVPTYVADAGVRSFNDLQRFPERFHRRIYAIEPGNDGNRIIATLIGENRFGLGGWTMMESSEQGMLGEVARAVHKSDWIVFLGWSPHPMNLRYRLTYLAGGEDTFGAGATIYTDARAGYLSECPNVGRLLRNLRFSPAIESRVMAMILDDRLDGRVAATRYLSGHADLLDGWLAGVTTFDGKPGIAAERASLATASLAHLGDGLQSANAWVVAHKIPLGLWLSGLVDWLTRHAQGFFDLVSLSLGVMIAGFTALLMRVPALLLIALCSLGAYLLQRKAGLALFIGAALLLIDNLGLWQATVQTLSLVIFSTLVCMVLGIPIGIAAAHRRWLYRILHPVLDLMQTIPTFVYLIPTLVLFGLGVVPGLISTVIFALPAPIRLTHLGISSVPRPLIEAGEAFGATPLQLLWKVELPSAAGTIVAGITQCIMLSLSMVVIAALVGAGGLGVPVVRALNSVQIGMGFEAGFTIVLLAIILDRISRPKDREVSR
jgi:glycine betaine/proline transport system substrate-binding protein